jgi:phosphoribosylformimino-5-aminoimidazole carboxamide ribotide isomerase
LANVQQQISDLKNGKIPASPTTYKKYIHKTNFATASMTKFRPCIDLHAGHVKQIVGGTLTENDSELKTNFVSEHTAGYYANLYKENGLTGAHVIMLGKGNDDAAKEAVRAWPGGLQIGGGITAENAAQWIEWGADKVRHPHSRILWD